MQRKKHFGNLLLNIISRIAVIAVVFALMVVMSQSAQAQSLATSGGWTEMVLYSFCSQTNCTDGEDPVAGLIFDAAGNLYGTTYQGGTYAWGTVFELMPKRGGSWTEQVLHSFNYNGTGGFLPGSGLILDAAGNLYGTTGAGGTYSNGTVFELTPTVGGGWTETVLYSFCSLTGCTDGAGPSGVIFDAAGNLYGTTGYGGSYGAGTVFELIPAAGGGWTEQVLHSFNNNGADGVRPSTGVIFDAAGNLYGTTLYGGTYSCDPYPGCGTAFELTPSGGGIWTEQVLHSFNYNGTDGVYPSAGLTFDAAGNLYGMTLYGGAYGEGTAFALTPVGDGWTEQLVHSFGNYPDGINPSAGLTFDASDNLYGTTEGGGTYNDGTVFELTPGGEGWTEQVLYSFNRQDGAFPHAGVIFDAIGNLYGTTQSGGAYGSGTVFELTPLRPCAKCGHSLLRKS